MRTLPTLVNIEVASGAERDPSAGCVQSLLKRKQGLGGGQRDSTRKDDEIESGEA
jgi:hypothetical protein